MCVNMTHHEIRSLKRIYIVFCNGLMSQIKSVYRFSSSINFITFGYDKDYSPSVSLFMMMTRTLLLLITDFFSPILIYDCNLTQVINPISMRGDSLAPCSCKISSKGQDMVNILIKSDINT